MKLTIALILQVLLTAFSCLLHAQQPLQFNILESYPFGYTKHDGTKVGTYWEYIQALNTLTQLNIEQQIVPKARIVEHLKLGIADAAILFRSKNMAPHVEFVSKIRDIPIVIVSKIETPINSYKQLYGPKGIGYFKSGSVSTKFDGDKNINKIAIYTYPRMIEMLKRDRVKAIVGNQIVIQSLIEKQCLQKTLRISPLILGSKEQWLVFSKKSKHLNTIPVFRKALNELKMKGVLDEIFDKHLTNTSIECV